MLKTIARWTSVKTMGDNLIRTADAAAPEPEGQNSIPIFIHPKALTFPILVGLVKGGWLAASALPISGFSSVWFPFTACLALGLLVAVANLLEEKTTLISWITGLLIGFLNSLVIFGAVLGIPNPR